MKLEYFFINVEIKLWFLENVNHFTLLKLAVDSKIMEEFVLLFVKFLFILLFANVIS